MKNLKEEALNSKNWAFQEAKTLLKRLNNKLPPKGYVLFQTGYGPSGLPHIGTFGENSRTTMLINAFKKISDMPVKLIAFSDDMDGLRKVPTNIPNQDLLANYLNYPLTKVPDPFGTHNSFGEHNNAELQKFLDGFGFEYELYSATKCYEQGLFDEAKLKILENHEKICDIIRPTLGEERRSTYSPFLPIDKETNNVLQAKVVSTNTKDGTLVYINEQGKEVETSIFGTHCKMQWKVDWAMRWYALNVDYEMCGKDLTDSVTLSSKIVKVLGKRPPQNLIYELFLDYKGEKISKSKGNGLSLDDWLKYGTKESLSLFMFQKPKTAKRLHFDIIPKSVDEYFQHVKAYPTQTDKEKLNNPAFHICNGNIPTNLNIPVSYSLLLNLATVVNAENKDILWSFIKKYSSSSNPQDDKELDNLCQYAVNYYQDFIKPNKKYIKVTEETKNILTILSSSLQEMPKNSNASDIQKIIYTIGKENGYENNLKDWFKLLYQTLLGQEAGPRFGGFVEIFGIPETIKLIDDAINNKLQ